MAIVDNLEAILRWALDKREHRRAEVRWFLQEVSSTCEALVRQPDLARDETVLLHEKLKALYEAAPGALRSQLAANELDQVLTALGSARMYYWIRVLEVDPEEAVATREGIPNPPGYFTPIVLSLSLQALYARRTSENLGGWLLEAKEQCLRDIAQLHVLRLSLGKSEA